MISGVVKSFVVFKLDVAVINISVLFTKCGGKLVVLKVVAFIGVVSKWDVLAVICGVNVGVLLLSIVVDNVAEVCSGVGLSVDIMLVTERWKNN